MVQFTFLQLNQEMNERAKKIIEDIVREVDVGEYLLR